MILARGVIEIYIAGRQAAEIVPILLASASGKGIERRDLIEQFAAPQREMVGKLVDELISRSILVDAVDAPQADRAETGLEIYYWHFGQSASASISSMNSKQITIIGVNTISRRIAAALQLLGMERVVVVDFHVLRNVRLFNSDGHLLQSEWPVVAPVDYAVWEERIANEELGCIVATSDFGGPYLMREWNRFCVANNVHFLPVVLDRFIGTIGPLIIPGESACYECVRLRENSNMDAPEIERTAEFHAAERQVVTGFHPAMTNVLGELAAMELSKFYGSTTHRRINQIIEVNLLAPGMVSRRVLKLPFCPVCSPALKTSSVRLDKDISVPGNPLSAHEYP